MCEERMSFEEIRKKCIKIGDRYSVFWLYKDRNQRDERGALKEVAIEINSRTARTLHISEYILTDFEEPATEKQKSFIQSMAKSFPIGGVLYKNQASMIIGELMKRKNNDGVKLSSFGQVEFLTKKGIEGAEYLSMEEATALISELKMHRFHATTEIFSKAKEMVRNAKKAMNIPEEIPASCPYGEIEIW